jgi:hypothetical protein
MLQKPQATCSVRHIFSDGLYTRELTMPAGTFAVGHYQKFEHLNVMVKGCVEVVNEDGTTTVLRAPLTFVGKPGRKVGYVHEDMVWLNVYSTNERDVDTLEATYLDKSETFLGAQQQIECHGSADYPKMLEDLGVTEQLVSTMSQNEDDQIPFPSGCYKVKVGRSGIHGKGLIATADILSGEPIAIARLDGKRTPAGRYTNHSKTPNARMIQNGSNIVLVALRDILGCLGGQDGEEITINYCDTVNLTLRMIK